MLLRQLSVLPETRCFEVRRLMLHQNCALLPELVCSHHSSNRTTLVICE
uniref:Uncharacterized protein n=1 Tax=Arundo donax TaxID=35708 RepID=A0A0A9EBR5_ARUDO